MIVAILRSSKSLLVRRDREEKIIDIEYKLLRDFSNLIPYDVEITLYDFIVRILNNSKGDKTYSLLRKLSNSYGFNLSDYDHIIKGIK